jgi:hypothetical protein
MKITTLSLIYDDYILWTFEVSTRVHPYKWLSLRHKFAPEKDWKIYKGNVQNSFKIQEGCFWCGILVRMNQKLGELKRV